MESAKSSSIYEHYNLPEDAESLKGKFKAKCKYCPMSISATGKTTSNLITHMKRKHSEQMMKSVKRSREQSEQTDMSTYMYKMKKYSATDPKQAKFLDNLPLFVASSLQSLSVVEDEDLRKMISGIDERIVVPSRKHLSTVLIPNKAESVHNKLTKLLGEVPYLSVTVETYVHKVQQTFLINILSVTEWFTSYHVTNTYERLYINI